MGWLISTFTCHRFDHQYFCDATVGTNVDSTFATRVLSYQGLFTTPLNRRTYDYGCQAKCYSQTSMVSPDIVDFTDEYYAEACCLTNVI